MKKKQIGLGQKLFLGKEKISSMVDDQLIAVVGGAVTDPSQCVTNCNSCFNCATQNPQQATCRFDAQTNCQLISTTTP